MSDAEFKANTRDSYNQELKEGFIGASNLGESAQDTPYLC